MAIQMEKPMNRTFKVFVGVLITLLAASSCMTLLEMGTISETKHANAKVKIPIEHLHNGVTNTTGASIVVTLVGEFGSHLNSLARGFGIQLLAKEAYDLDTNLVLKQPGSLKIRKNDRESEMAKKTKEDLQRCFPNLRKYSFYFGNSTEFKFRTSQQEGWEIANATLLQKINGPTLQEVKDAINHAKYLSEETTTKPQIIYHSDLILPLVNSQSKKEDVFVDQYYDEIRHWFEFDELECCKKVPDPDESVFYFRNVLNDLSVQGTNMGREELSPHKIANELFGRLTPGEKVAIVGKHYEDSKMQEISLELEAALDLNVRIIHNNFDYEDFCFLRKAQKELVGSVRSNFLKWASYLSDAKIIRWYIVDHVALQNHVLDFKNIIGDFQYDWTHHSLKSRIQLEYYRSENVEYDRLEGLHRDSGGRDDVSRNTSVVKHPTYITGLTSVDSNQSFTNGTIDLESPFITFAATAKSELTMETSTEEGDAFIGVPLSTISVGTTSLTTNHNNTTLVVQMSGELGNQISKIVYGLGLKLFAKQKYGIDLGIKLRAQENSKWLHAMKDTKECFPKTRVLNFRECNTDEFLHMKKQQQMWVGDNDSKLLHFRGNDNFNQTHVEKGLSFLQSTLARMDIPPTDTTANITLPFLYADTFAVASTFLIDLYYEEIRDFFTFDDSVCKALPYPDETVMHVRNFLVEMPRKGEGWGFEELSPQQVASDLFANHQPGDKVAIISRFSQGLQGYQEALEAKGLKVRILEDQSGIQDFCFLLRAQYQIIGVATSTYSTFAGILGDAKKVRLYSVDSAARRDDSRRFGEFFTSFDYTNEELKSRFSFELIKKEDQDEEQGE